MQMQILWKTDIIVSKWFAALKKKELSRARAISRSRSRTLAFALSRDALAFARALSRHSIQFRQL